jgi:hypothetical protein
MADLLTNISYSNRNKKKDKEAVVRRPRHLLDWLLPSEQCDERNGAVKANMSNDNIISPTDDYEVAKQKIFDTIENAEKVVLTATKDLIHDEVKTFFGKHEHEFPPHEKKVEKKKEVLGRSRRGVDNDIKSTKKTSAKTEEESQYTKFARFLDDYIRTDYE